MSEISKYFKCLKRFDTDWPNYEEHLNATLIQLRSSSRLSVLVHRLCIRRLYIKMFVVVAHPKLVADVSVLLFRLSGEEALFGVFTHILLTVPILLNSRHFHDVRC